MMRLVGRLLFQILGRERRRTVRHLTVAYGEEKSEKEIQAMAKQVFLHFITTIVDLIQMPKLLNKGLDHLITSEGMEHINKAMASGRGTIMITGHFGNWELLGAWLVRHGIPLKVVGTTLYDPRLDKIVVETRNCAGYTNIPRGKGTREIIRSLKEGAAIGMLIDQDTRVQGDFVNFYGKPTYTPTGPAVLARKFNIPIIPIFMWMRDDFTYHIECGKPLALVKTDNGENDIVTNTQKCSDTYEQIIRRFPTQWAWMHQRWKTKPDLGQVEQKTQ